MPSPMPMPELMKRIVEAAVDLNGEDVRETVTMIRRGLELTATVYGPQARLANLILSAIVEGMYRQLGPQMFAAGEPNPPDDQVRA